MSFAEQKKIATYFAMATLGVPTAALITAGSMGVFDREPIPDDPELAVFLQTNFPEISQAVDNPGQNIVIYPAEERIQGIHDLMLKNEGHGDYLRLGSMGEGANLFNEVASDGLYIRALRCDVQAEASDIYNCRFIVAERGGIVDPGYESFAEIPACTLKTYNAVVARQENDISISLNQGNVRGYEHRIDPARALHGHVDMSQFNEDNPHLGPGDLNEISVSSHVHFHTTTLRSGDFSLSFFMTFLGEEQVLAEKVLARFSECIKGAEQPSLE